MDKDGSCALETLTAQDCTKFALPTVYFGANNDVNRMWRVKYYSATDDYVFISDQPKGNGLCKSKQYLRFMATNPPAIVLVAEANATKFKLPADASLQKVIRHGDLI